MYSSKGVPKPHINADGSCSYIWMDLYKPSGKWEYGGVVYVGDVKPWQDSDLLMDAIRANQDIVVDSALVGKHGEYWTIVVDDLVSLAKLPEYKFLWKRIMQIGRDE